MGDQWFLPQQVVVSAGTIVLWINRGQLAHTATARDSSGRYLYFCTLHGDMIGEVNVRFGGRAASP